MKLNEAEVIVRSKTDVPISDLMQQVVEEAWQSGLYEVMELLEKINPSDIALWSLRSQDGALVELFDSYSKSTGVKIDSIKLGALASRKLGVSVRELLEKVSSFSEDRGLPFFDFLVESRASANLSSQIQKNATKQGLYEPIAAAYINVHSHADVKVLAESESKFEVRFGPDGSRIVENSGPKKKSGSKSKKKDDTISKSADLLACVFEKSKCTAYLLSHKYARVGGGHQMNQRTDAVKFLAYASISASSGRGFPELLTFVNEQFGTSIAPDDFQWQPGLVLDGRFFDGAKLFIESNDSYPQLKENKFFIGTSDEFVDHLENQLP